MKILKYNYLSIMFVQPNMKLIGVTLYLLAEHYSKSDDILDCLTPPIVDLKEKLKWLFIPPANCVCGRVYCFHVVRPTDRPTERMCVRNVLFP